jgi:hypothetical protein
LVVFLQGSAYLPLSPMLIKYTLSDSGHGQEQL